MNILVLEHREQISLSLLAEWARYAHRALPLLNSELHAHMRSVVFL
jgi:hypothetical protein